MVTDTVTFYLEILKYINVIILALTIVTGFSLKNLILVGLSLFQLVQVVVFYYITKLQIAVPVFLTDKFSIALALVLLVAGLIIDVFILRALKKEEKRHSSLHQVLLYIVLFVLPVLLSLFIVINDFLWLYYIVLTVMLGTYYVAIYGEHEQNMKDSGYYLITAMAGSTLILNSLILMYGQSQILTPDFFTQTTSGQAFSAAIVACLGGVIIAGIFPFDGWLFWIKSRTLSLASINYAITSICGVSLILRIATAYDGTVLPYMLTFIGGFSFIAASILMNIERRRSFASIYFAIAHIGLTVLCISLQNPAAHMASKLMMLFGIPAMTLLFISEGILDIDDSNKKRTQRLILSAQVISLMGVLSLAVPPFAGFSARLILLETTIDTPGLFLLLACGILLNIMFVARRLATIRFIMPRSIRGSKFKATAMAFLLFTIMIFVFGGSAPISYILSYLGETQPVFADTWNKSDIFLSDGILWLFKQGNLIGSIESLSLVFILLMGVSLIPAFHIINRNRPVIPRYTCGVDIQKLDISEDDFAQDEYLIVDDKHASTALPDAILIKSWISILASAIFVVILGVAL